MREDPPKDLLDWLRFSNVPNWAVARPLGALFGFLIFVLFLTAFGAAFYTLLGVFIAPDRANLGTGALIVALMGAPFVVWRTMIAQRDLNFKKEGHITDRINKAVEQLGAEKKVDKIGRPVTIWTGKSEDINLFFANGKPDDPKPRSVELSREWDNWTSEDGDFIEGRSVSYRVWPLERTVIEWQNQPLSIAAHEHLGAEGEWKVFSESVPNIEVRIGAILSLERIAQDSTAYDKGRDHVRVMEILCAYIRENAPASLAQNHPDGDWEPLADDATDEQYEAHEEKRSARFDLWPHWIDTIKPPREDVVLALKVIERRTLAQRLVEANWPEAGPAADWVFDRPAPQLPDDDVPHGGAVLQAFLADLEKWKERLSQYNGYRPDLRGTNLQKADFAGYCLSGIRLANARLEGASLRGARLEGASLANARLEGASLRGARLEGASLAFARLEGVSLFEAHFEGASLMGVRLEGASLRGARLEGASLAHARLEGALLIDTDLSTCSGLRRPQIGAAFGLADVVLPERLTRPLHWPGPHVEDPWREYRKWLADPASYKPPPPAPDTRDAASTT